MKKFAVALIIVAGFASQGFAQHVKQAQKAQLRTVAAVDMKKNCAQRCTGSRNTAKFSSVKSGAAVMKMAQSMATQSRTMRLSDAIREKAMPSR